MFIKVCHDGDFERRELKLISHRGGKGFGPENTLRSLQGALDYGVEMIETDVRISSDGVPVIHHGPFLGINLLGRMSLEEIRDKAPDVPTLREYLDLAGDRCAINLEVKRCDAGALAAVLDDARPSRPVLVSSFDEDFLEAFRESGCPVELGLLTQYELSVERMIDAAGRVGASTILPASFILSDGLVKTAHDAGMKVIAWTVNSTALLRETLTAGVDGVITDSYPEMKSFLESELQGAPEVAGALDCGGSTS